MDNMSVLGETAQHITHALNQRIVLRMNQYLRD